MWLTLTEMTDDWYKGYFIPKGAAIVVNWWAIDAVRWKDADVFNPSRFLNDPYSSAEAVNLADANLRHHFTYGSGRRICPGMHVAQHSLFINMARTLWAFNIKKATGKDGKPVEVSPANVEPGFVLVPKRFPAVFEVRSEKHAAIVEQTWAEAEKEGLIFERKKKGAL